MLTKSSSDRGLTWDTARRLVGSLWPSLTARDSESHRRKKLAVRGVHLAMVGMVAVAVAGAVISGAPKLSAVRLLSVIVVAVAYVAWSFYGWRDAVRFALWHNGTTPSPSWPANTRLGSALYLAAQFAMAALIMWLAGPARLMGLLWLVLLPPIGHSVLFLRWPGITIVSVLSIAIHSVNIVWWHGWYPLPQALPGFLVAVLFTLAFVQIAVSAEQARGEVQRLAGELGDANAKLREYALQAEELAATRERNQMAREIHDSLGHYLTVVHIQLEAARSTFGNDPANTLDALGKAQSMTRAGLQEIRRSVAALRVSPLHNRPVGQAIRSLATESDVAGLTTQVSVLGEARALSPQAELTLYRAAQEGLTNCRKHSQSTTVSVLLDFRTLGAVRLVVADQGVGADDTTGGFGLLGLRERAQLLGGQVRVQTAPGRGFTLEVEVPG